MSPGHHSKSAAAKLEESSLLPVGGAGSAVEEEELPAAPSGSESRREALDSRPLLSHNSISRSLSLSYTYHVVMNKNTATELQQYIMHAH